MNQSNTAPVQVGGEITGQYISEPGMEIQEHDIQQDPYIEPNPDKKWFINVDINKEQLQKFLDDLDEAMKQFCTKYDIPDDLFDILINDGIKAFGKALKEQDSDAFAQWWMLVCSVTAPFLGMFLKKQGISLEQHASTLGKAIGYSGDVIAFLPLLLYGGKTIYDDFFKNVRFMGTNEQNAQFTTMDSLGLIADLFLMPGGVDEKALSIIISGVMTLIDVVTWIYNGVETQDQLKKVDEWYKQSQEQIDSFSDKIRHSSNYDNVYIDFLM